jgi:DNA-binding response OmpR family regulator
MSILIEKQFRLTMEEQAEGIWECSYPNTTDTLRVYIKCIRTKIEKDMQLSDVIHSGPGVGYYLKTTSLSISYFITQFSDIYLLI